MKAQYVKDLRPYNTAAIVSKEMPLRSMVENVVEHPEVRYLCVVDESNKLLGLISRKRLFQAIFLHHVPASSMVSKLYTLLTSEQASDLLVTHVITCRETDSMNDLINIMIKRRLDAIPVLDKNGRLEGIVSIEHIFLKWLQEEETAQGRDDDVP